MKTSAQPFTIAYDAQSHVLEVVVRGLWDLDLAKAFVEELHAQESAVLASKTGPHRYGVAIDAREHGVQPKEVAEILMQYTVTAAPGWPIALIVSSSTLHKMQLHRIAAPVSRLGIFDSNDAARAWLSAAIESGSTDTAP